MKDDVADYNIQAQIYLNEGPYTTVVEAYYSLFT